MVQCLSKLSQTEFSQDTTNMLGLCLNYITKPQGSDVYLPRTLKYFTWFATASVTLSPGQVFTPLGNRIDLLLLSNHCFSISLWSRGSFFSGEREVSVDSESVRKKGTARLGSWISSKDL